MGASEFSVVCAEEDCGVIENSQFTRHIHDSTDFEVNHGDVSPVDSDELLPLIVIEGRCRPVGCVVLLDLRFTDERVTEVFGQGDIVRIDQVEPLVGEEVGKVRAKEVNVQAEGLSVFLPIGCIFAKLLNGAIGQETLEGCFFWLIEACCDDVSIAASRELSSPEVVCPNWRKAMFVEPCDVLFIGDGVFCAPIGVVIGAELVGEVRPAVILSDDAYVVARIAKCLSVGPGPKGNHRLVGDVPFRVGQYQVLSWALSCQK